MEIWVRSQDKECLRLCNEFRICEIVKNKKIVGHSVDCFDVELGVYSTKEKALKVMDKLADCIGYFKSREILDRYRKDSWIYQYNYVINMPQDEEVEE